MSKHKILIIDDDVAVSTMVKCTLEYKYDVATTTSASSAFKYLADNKVDLILLDIKMPQMNGIDALAEIKKRHPDVNVIMLTAYASDENKEKAKTLGAFGFITKPFDIDEFRKYVDMVFLQNVNSGRTIWPPFPG